MFIDEDPGSTDRVLKTAQRLVGRNGDDIVALVTHKQPLTADRFSAVSPHSSPLCVQRCAANVEAILQAVGNWNPQLLLIDRSSQLLSESAINALITLLPCPLALVQ